MFLGMMLLVLRVCVCVFLSSNKELWPGTHYRRMVYNNACSVDFLVPWLPKDWYSAQRLPDCPFCVGSIAYMPSSMYVDTVSYMTKSRNEMQLNCVKQ